MGLYKKYFSIFLLFISTLTCEAKYFQQEVNFTIKVSLNDKTHELSAFETLIYKNNSPVALNEIYFHLYPSAYKNNNTVLANEIFLSGDNRMLSMNEKGFGFIDSLNFEVNGEKVKWNLLVDTIDICRIVLNRPLNPGDSITIATPFHVKIPSADISRLGHEGQAYFITQWFPKPAVYDERGWNYFPYYDQGEYYSEFGTFDVFITLPENYVLGATGVMVDGEKEIAWLNKKDSLTRLIKDFPKNDSTILSSKTFKTIHYRQDKVHDFAWFADKRWHVLKDIIVREKSGRKITSWSFFNNREAKYWLKSPEYIRDGINYYSDWVGEYPYDEVTAVDVGYATGNGMEYPMITAIGNYGDRFDLETTIVHEVGHNWFYGILGSNEHVHPWMDEGVNNFYEARYVYTKHKDDSLSQEESSGLTRYDLSNKTNTINHRKKQYFAYLASARKNTDQAPDISADKFSIPNYHRNVYSKSTISFDYLKSYLGDSLFDACMREYYNEWRFKHPQPEDMQGVFERASGKKLDWIFIDLLKTNKKLDYKMECSEIKNPGTTILKLRNKGDVYGPIPLNEMKGNKIISTKWIQSFRGDTAVEVPCNDCDSYKIDAEDRMPELSEANNSIRMKGMFRKIEKIKFSMGIFPESGKTTNIFFSPVVGWNYYNEFMAGAIFHNISFHEKKFEYRLMPMYSTGTSDLAGGARFDYHFYPENSKINRITLSSTVSRYAFMHDEYEALNDSFVFAQTLHFTKIDSKIIFSFLGNNRQERIKNEITLRSVINFRDLPFHINHKVENRDYIYWQAEYRNENTNPLNRSLKKLEVTYSNDFLSVLGETKYFLNYDNPEKGFSIRLFGGYTIIPKTGAIEDDYEMSLNGRDGEGDYLFDEVFLGRTETSGILSKQFVNDYAGFKSPTSFYRKARDWMFGFNVNTTLPGLIPFRLFANAGTFDNAASQEGFGNISWELGIDLPVIKDVFIIYLPFAYSEDIKDAVEKQDFSTGDLIRFELHLNLLNPIDHKIKTAYSE